MRQLLHLFLFTFLPGVCGKSNIDIWKLKLDGTGKEFIRLANFNDYVGGKASNPVIQLTASTWLFNQQEQLMRQV